MRKLILALVVVIVILITWLLLRPAPVPTYYETFEQTNDLLERAKLAYNAPLPVHGEQNPRPFMREVSEFLKMHSEMHRYVAGAGNDTTIKNKLINLAAFEEKRASLLDQALATEAFEEIINNLRSFGDMYLQIYMLSGMAYSTEIPDYMMGFQHEESINQYILDGNLKGAQDVVNDAYNGWIIGGPGETNDLTSYIANILG
jgi:hypothetical protein